MSVNCSPGLVPEFCTLPILRPVPTGLASVLLVMLYTESAGTFSAYSALPPPPAPVSVFPLMVTDLTWSKKTPCAGPRTVLLVIVTPVDGWIPFAKGWSFLGPTAMPEFPPATPKVFQVSTVTFVPEIDNGMPPLWPAPVKLLVGDSVKFWTLLRTAPNTDPLKVLPVSVNCSPGLVPEAFTLPIVRPAPRGLVSVLLVMLYTESAGMFSACSALADEPALGVIVFPAIVALPTPSK